MNMQRAALMTLATITLGLARAGADEPKWKQHTINGDSQFEAAGVFDVDKDGRLDIVSGDTWYQAPDWSRHQVREVSKTGTYYNCFATLPFDVNKDGWTDFLTCAYFTKNIGWVENPGDPNKEWTYHPIDEPGTIEAAQFVDFNGDGKPEILPNATNVVVFYALEPPSGSPSGWARYDFGPAAAGHGVGSGDVDGDGRIDILTPKGWFQNPLLTVNSQFAFGGASFVTTRNGGAGSRVVTYQMNSWPWHPDWNLGATGIQILARDVDGDGLSDVVYGMGHNYGLYWLKQVKASDGSHAWVKKPIDETIASVHTLVWADLDGDGHAQELVTGKRVYAHEIEPGATDGSVIAWYKFNKSKNAWDKHVIFQGEPATDAPAEGQKRDALKDFPRGTAGTGLQLTAIDIDGDGDTDLVCPGKSGLYWFENLGSGD
jgi:hypothetical protein